MRDLDDKKLKESYVQHLYNSRNRGIPFNFSYKEWLSVWSEEDDNGEPFWWNMGSNPQDLVMSRYGDVGPYEPGNVFIQTNKENLRQSAEKRSQSHLRKTWWFGFRDGEPRERWELEIDFESDSNQWEKLKSSERIEISCTLHDRNRKRRDETCDQPGIKCVCSEYALKKMKRNEDKKEPWE